MRDRFINKRPWGRYSLLGHLSDRIFGNSPKLKLNALNSRVQHLEILFPCISWDFHDRICMEVVTKTLFQCEYARVGRGHNHNAVLFIVK